MISAYPIRQISTKTDNIYRGSADEVAVLSHCFHVSLCRVCKLERHSAYAIVNSSTCQQPVSYQSIVIPPSYLRPSSHSASYLGHLPHCCNFMNLTSRPQKQKEPGSIRTITAEFKKWRSSEETCKLIKLSIIYFAFGIIQSIDLGK